MGEFLDCFTVNMALESSETSGTHDTASHLQHRCCENIKYDKDNELLCFVHKEVSY